MNWPSIVNYSNENNVLFRFLLSSPTISLFVRELSRGRLLGGGGAHTCDSALYANARSRDSIMMLLKSCLPYVNALYICRVHCNDPLQPGPGDGFPYRVSEDGPGECTGRHTPSTCPTSR